MLSLISALIFTLFFSIFSFGQNQFFGSPYFYSPFGSEMLVQFNARFLTNFKTISEMNLSLENSRMNFAQQSIEPTIKYLFGPLTQRGLGAIKATHQISIAWEQANETSRGVELPYTYIGQWLLDVKFLDLIQNPIPLPYNNNLVFSQNWKKCTDDAHDTQSFYWYYWDPSRYGCDQIEGREFQNILLMTSSQTLETTKSYPEYSKLIQNNNGVPTLAMTFAFGYVEESENPHPETDSDMGAREYQYFLQEFKRMIPSNALDQPIYRNEYPFHANRKQVIGHRFTFKQEEIQIVAKVVINAGVDQMILFAQSFAHDQDGFFAWMGHSRVGSGFDAARFAQMLKDDPEIYKLTSNYQIIYWGGCNSYSYYTIPFFKLKSEISSTDPFGTRNLDIMANGLPSYFSLNATNALIQAKAFLNWKSRTSYQDILAEIEEAAGSLGVHVLAVVIGDEDNL